MKNHITLTLSASALALIFSGVASSVAEETKPKKEGEAVGAVDHNSSRSNVSEIDKSEEDGVKAYATDYNSIRSNNSTSIPKGKSGYSFSLDFALQSKATSLSAQEYEALVDEALAEMKTDLMGNYQNVAVGLEKHQAKAKKAKAR